MPERPLQDVGVLVTRPRTQAAELVAAIERDGGRAWCFPVLEILALDDHDVRAAAAALPPPDFTIFVSRNAVEFGIEYTGDGRIAAIGPATARAVADAGRVVDIQPAGGYDSEHLLAEPALTDVAGRNVRIIRGTSGRELLADELRTRGARVDYLPVYERRLPKPRPEELADLEARWRQGQIDVVIAMSRESLQNLVALLPPWCAAQLESTPLVTPSGRVIKEVLDRFPASRPILAPGPGADDMVNAIIATTKPFPD